MRRSSRAARAGAAACLALPLLAGLPDVQAAPASASATAAATTAGSGTAWLCNLSDDAVHLVCLADVDPRDPAADGAAAATAQVRGTRFPLDPRQTWVVDLWSPPSDFDAVEALARATICFRSPGCSVTLALPANVVARLPRMRTVSVR